MLAHKFLHYRLAQLQKHPKERTFEQTPPYHISLPPLPLSRLHRPQKGHLPLQQKSKQLYAQRKEVRNVRILSVYSDGNDGCYRSDHEYQLC